MTELWVKDKFGKARDIILGYDDNVSPRQFMATICIHIDYLHLSSLSYSQIQIIRSSIQLSAGQ